MIDAFLSADVDVQLLTFVTLIVGVAALFRDRADLRYIGVALLISLVGHRVSSYTGDTEFAALMMVTACVACIPGNSVLSWCVGTIYVARVWLIVGASAGYIQIPEFANSVFQGYENPEHAFAQSMSLVALAIQLMITITGIWNSGRYIHAVDSRTGGNRHSVH